MTEKNTSQELTKEKKAQLFCLLDQLEEEIDCYPRGSEEKRRKVAEINEIEAKLRGSV